MLEQCPFSGFVVPSMNERGRFYVAPETQRRYEKRSSFTPAQLRLVGRVIGQMKSQVMPSIEGGSALTCGIVQGFSEAVSAGELPFFPETVFQGLMAVVSRTVEDCPQYKSATSAMLETAGAAGIGVIVNVTGNYLRRAMSERANPAKRVVYRRLDLEDFGMDRNIPGSADLGYIKCLGQAFTEAALGSVKDAARAIVASPRQDVQRLLENGADQVLGPKNKPAFYEAFNIKPRVIEYARLLKPSVGPLI